MSHTKNRKQPQTFSVKDSEGNEVLWTLHDDGVYSYTDRYGVEHRCLCLDIVLRRFFFCEKCVSLQDRFLTEIVYET